MNKELVSHRTNPRDLHWVHTSFAGCPFFLRKVSRLFSGVVAVAAMAVSGHAGPAGEGGSATPPDYSAPAGAPYSAQDVTVPTPMGHKLAGTLTLPKAASRTHPVGAIVTITGSGPQDRDEALGIGDYRLFRQLADSLSSNGIAVLRMDDRGTGASQGTFKGATSADFAEDIRAGLAYLRTCPEIDSARLGLIGHSEGAIIAPMVALKEPTLRAIVLLAGVARPAREALAYQLANNINHSTNLSRADKDTEIAGIPKKIDKMMADDPWLAFFLTHDPTDTARHVKSPAVLILTGANDQQADPKQVPDLMAAFLAAGNTDVTAQVVPGVNHLFVPDADGFPGDYAKLPPPLRMEPGIVQTITDWLILRVRQHKRQSQETRSD